MHITATPASYDIPEYEDYSEPPVPSHPRPDEHVGVDHPPRQTTVVPEMTKAQRQAARKLEKEYILENNIIQHIATDKSLKGIPTNWDALKYMYTSKGKKPPKFDATLAEWVDKQILRFQSDAHEFHKDLQAKERLSEDLSSRGGSK